jgi:hypothetical protein
VVDRAGDGEILAVDVPAGRIGRLADGHRSRQPQSRRGPGRMVDGRPSGTWRNVRPQRRTGDTPVRTSGTPRRRTARTPAAQASQISAHSRHSCAAHCDPRANNITHTAEICGTGNVAAPRRRS